MIEMRMLCHFAHQFPSFVADFLGSSRDLGRRFREETITDIMMASLRLMGDDRVIVRFPNEAQTGADMEWNFVNVQENPFYRLVIQAKCAYGESPDWGRHSYRYLSHTIRGRFQADLLCDEARQSARPTYPLYIFYNPRHTCSLATEAGWSGIEGGNLANGYLIRSFATGGERHLSRIGPYMSSLRGLFCQFENKTDIPNPIDVRSYLLANCGASFSLPEQIMREIGIVVPPEVGTSIPDDIQTIIDHKTPRSREGSSSSRWSVTFISNNSPERAPD